MDPQPGRKHFVIDSMLGRVATWLRIFGFDTDYVHIQNREQILGSLALGAIPVTRNTRFASIPGVIFPSSDDSFEQLAYVLSQATVTRSDIHPLTRCTRCNSLLDPLTRDEAEGLVPEFIFETHHQFYTCADCGRIYWPGSHSRHIMDRLTQLFN